MAIQDRHLAIGTTLTARYKGTVYTAEVVQEGDALRYRLADGRTFKSPSAAGSAVMGGNACNGWAFWTVETGTDATAPQDAASEQAQAQPKPRRGKAKSETAPAQVEETATA